MVYVVDVSAESYLTPNCGALGRQVSFRLAGQPLTPVAAWNNARLHLLPLSLRYEVFLPLALSYH